MSYLSKAWQLLDNYVIARYQNRPSTALFWYLPEPTRLKSQEDLHHYQSVKLPCYLIDYRQKLNYTLTNQDGIIVLPYHAIGAQINPEAAFQYALGLHDHFMLTQNQQSLEHFWHYVNYFISQQNKMGLWSYQFDWYGSKAPWYSALAQSRGASLMLRAYLHSKNPLYLDAAKDAFKQFSVPTHQGGFLHQFAPTNDAYFEEYPNNPTAVLNGFMASLFGIWELRHFANEKLDDLWQLGIVSLKNMLPYYSNGWWSLYDLDQKSPILNVNSPRYHLLEIDYLRILTLLTDEPTLHAAYETRVKQYDRLLSRGKALCLKSIRKIIYK